MSDTQPRIEDVIDRLCALLPIEAVAAIAYVEPTTMRRWQMRTSQPEGGSPDRLQLFYEMIWQVREAVGPEQILAWLMRPDPQLGFAPIQIFNKVAVTEWRRPILRSSIERMVADTYV